MSTSETMMYEWDRIDWCKLERGVFKLQKRIYQTSRRQFFKLGDRLVYVALPRGDASQQPSRLAVACEHCQDKTGRPVGMDDNHHVAEEPDEGKLSRPVLKTSSGSDTRA